MNKKELQENLNFYYKDCENRRRLNHLTMCAYKNDLTQYINYIETDFMNIQSIVEYIYFLNQNYTKSKTVKRKIASIKAFYSYLEFEEIIDFSPFRKIRTQIKEPNYLPKVINNKDLENILSVIYGRINSSISNFKKKIAIRNAAIIELLFSTGIRISELCNIKKADINLNDGILRIFGKGSKERILYIGNENVIHILTNYYEVNKDAIEKNEYFFLNKSNNKLSDQSVRILLNNIEKELQLSHHITPHMFRHTFATMLLDKDVDIRYIQKILGHSSISITQIYTHVSINKQKEILTMKNPRNDYTNYSEV